MGLVNELLDCAPSETAARSVQRDEELFFVAPSERSARFLNQDVPPLAVYAFASVYEPVQFAAPRGVFESADLRVEWQTIHGRQPFYHRNLDAEEISYQVCGERTLMTECGTVELRPGDFTAIPAPVAHDNFGREDIHLIFYLKGAARACVKPAALGEYRIPPFAGWEGQRTLEVSTDALGAPGTDVSAQIIDEAVLLGAARRFEDKIQLLRPGGKPGVMDWMYKSDAVWIGHMTAAASKTRDYVRRVCAEEIQYQIEGSRTLISQRGTVTLGPGEFTAIPRGCAYTQIAHGPSRHVSVLSATATPPVCEPVRQAVPSTAELLAKLTASDDAPRKSPSSISSKDKV